MSDQPKPQSQPDTDEFDPNALAAIRDLIAGDDSVEEPLAEDEAELAENVVSAAPEPKRSRFAPLPPQEKSDTKPKKAAKKTKPRKPKGDGWIDLWKAKITGYRPSAKHIIVASLVLLVLFRPWLVLAFVFLSAFIMIGVFLILGYDGFWRRTMQVARWYARKHPSRSVELHRKLDDFAMRFDAFLDRFPEGSVDGLYLPDFGDVAEAEARHDEALERRLEGLRENEA